MCCKIWWSVGGLNAHCEMRTAPLSVEPLEVYGIVDRQAIEGISPGQTPNTNRIAPIIIPFD